MLRTRDNWERLVAAVLKKQQLWELFHAHSRSPSVLSEASSSDLSSSSFREIDISSAYWQQLEDAVTRLENRVQKLVLVSDFVPSFDVEDVNLTSLELLGTGTFGETYACDVSDEVKIVVKRIKAVVVSEEEFKRSMDFCRRIRHVNVVALRAYYCSQDEKLMLYDYYRKGSVHHLLHGKTNEFPAQVRWETRIKIAIGAARGLASIHAQNGGTLVHGNVKSSNILLNRDSYGCISDLGITNLTSARFMKDARCYAPEVKNSTQNVTRESDVYSFGILLFELLTRKSPDAVDLVKLMKYVKSKQMTPKVFDADLLLYPLVREQMVRVLQIGISCVVKSAKKRPKMSEVTKMLEDLEIGSTPKIGSLVFVHQNNDVSESEDPFDLRTLLRASAETLGKGTFGTSYKAILETGLILRVKRLKDANVTSQEFQQHMDNISRIRHRNCAALMAYYFSKDEVLFVYDYYDEDSLFSLIHGGIGPCKPLSFEARLQIALTIAKGIHHIHKQDATNLVHGNIRSSNIFIDKKNSAIIADIAQSKLSNPIRYTALKERGYIAPEVIDTRNASRAADVYSFGVVLLELLTRKSPQETRIDDRDISLAKWAQNHVRADTLYEVFDAELLGSDQVVMVEVLLLAMDCVETVPERRPAMFEVVNRLQEISGIYDEESEPSIEYGFEGTRLEDALEDQMSRLTIHQW